MSDVGWVPSEGAGVREMFADGKISGKNSGLPASVAVPTRTEAVLGGSGSTRRGSSAYSTRICTSPASVAFLFLPNATTKQASCLPWPASTSAPTGPSRWCHQGSTAASSRVVETPQWKHLSGSPGLTQQVCAAWALRCASTAASCRA